MPALNDDERRKDKEVHSINDFMRLVELGKVIAFKHYNMSNYGDCNVLEIGENLLRVQLPKKYEDLNIAEGEIVKLGYVYRDIVYTINAKVHCVRSLLPLQLVLKISRICTRQNLRQSKRYRVSLPAHVIVAGAKKTAAAVVKDVSKGGLMIYCKKNLKKDAEIGVRILSKETVQVVAEDSPKLSLKAKVIRKSKSKREDIYIYGLRVIDGEVPVELFVDKDKLQAATQEE